VGEVLLTADEVAQYLELEPVAWTALQKQAALANLITTHPQLGVDRPWQSQTWMPQTPALIMSRTTGAEPCHRRDTEHVGS
jgi:hypothetical protein